MFLFNLLFTAVNVGIVAAIVVAAARVANHLRNNKVATEAVVEHVFGPVFRSQADEEEPAAPAGWSSVGGGASTTDGAAETPRRNR